MTHEEFVQRVMVELNDKELTTEAIQTAMHIVLHGLTLAEECTDLIPADADKRAVELRRFLACKMVEGCTKSTINFYSGVLKRFMLEMPKPFAQVKIDDVRYYIAVRGQRDNLSKASQDNTGARTGSSLRRCPESLKSPVCCSATLNQATG